MKFPHYLYALACMALLFTACDKAADDVLPSTFAELALQDDQYVTQVNQPVLLSILANDHITAPAQITLSAPQHGYLTPGPEAGQYYYHPDSAFTGTDSLSYTACIEAICKNARVSISVNAIPCTVVANFDADTTLYNHPIVINVLANDVLCGTPPLQIDLLAGSSTIREMVTVLNDNTVLFTPQDGFYGVASFGYRISNGTSQAEGMVKVLVRQPITQLCTDIVAQPDQAYMSTGSPYQQPLDLKALALQNDQICPNYPFTFELVGAGNLYYGNAYQVIYGSDTTYHYSPAWNTYGTETIYYRLRQQLLTTEVVTPPTPITIHLAP